MSWTKEKRGMCGEVEVREREEWRDRKVKRQTDRQAGRDRQRQTETERDRDRETDTERDRDRERRSTERKGCEAERELKLENFIFQGL